MADAAINLSLADVADPFAAIPEGEYTLQVTDVGTDPSKAGDPMVKITAQVVGHEDRTGANLFDYCVLGVKGQKFGAWRLRSWCEGSGVDLETPISEIDWDDLKGHEVQAMVTVTPPSGEYGEGNQVSKILRD